MNLGLGPSPEDKIYTISGVGGNEFVYEKILSGYSFLVYFSYSFVILLFSGLNSHLISSSFSVDES